MVGEFVLAYSDGCAAELLFVIDGEHKFIDGVAAGHRRGEAATLRILKEMNK